MDEDAFSAITFFCYNCGSSWFACSSNSSDMFNIICLTCLDNIDNMDKFDKFTSNEDMAIKLVGINEEEGMGDFNPDDMGDEEPDFGGDEMGDEEPMAPEGEMGEGFDDFEMKSRFRDFDDDEFSDGQVVWKKV